MTKKYKDINKNEIKTYESYEYGWFFCPKSSKIKRYVTVKTWYI